MTGKRRNGKSGRAQNSAFKPWDGQRGMSPEALALRLEKEAMREVFRDHDNWLAVLDRATPEQIAAASRGCMSTSATASDIATAWARLRTMVNA